MGGCSKCNLRCSQDFLWCQNPGTPECNIKPLDIWQDDGMVVIYGSHRLLPGDSFSVKVVSCYKARARVGFAVPPLHGSNYSVPKNYTPSVWARNKPYTFNRDQYWTDEAYYWDVGGVSYNSMASGSYHWSHYETSEGEDMSTR